MYSVSPLAGRPLPQVNLSPVQIGRNIHFSALFEENENWHNYEGIDVSSTLQEFYPELYIRGALNRHLFKLALTEVGDVTDRTYRMAKDVFKNLFKMPYRLRPGSLTSLRTCEVIKKISHAFGSNILAHGIEEAKGGLYTLLLMCMSKKVLIPACYWGEFCDGMPNISPLTHGPYYLVSTSLAPRDDAPLESILWVLLPCDEVILMLNEKLMNLMEMGWITAAEQDDFSRKFITYEGYLAILERDALHSGRMTMPSDGSLRRSERVKERASPYTYHPKYR